MLWSLFDQSSLGGLNKVIRPASCPVLIVRHLTFPEPRFCGQVEELIKLDSASIQKAGTTDSKWQLFYREKKTERNNKRERDSEIEQQRECQRGRAI